jgi:hypothetical protein
MAHDDRCSPSIAVVEARTRSAATRLATPAEPVASSDAAGICRGGLRRVVEVRPAEGTMWAVLVVVLLGRIEPTKRFAVAVARGARQGVRMILTSISASTASNDAVNFASRSRITNRKRGQHP